MSVSAVTREQAYSSEIPTGVKLAATIAGDAALAVVAIPWDPARMSANARLHWRALDKLKGRARQAATFGWRLAGSPVLAVPVEVDVLVFRARRMDDDNVISGLKSLRDQLCDTPPRGHGMLPSDAAQWWRYRAIEFFIGKDYGAKGAAGPWCVLVFRERTSR